MLRIACALLVRTLRSGQLRGSRRDAPRRGRGQGHGQSRAHGSGFRGNPRPADRAQLGPNVQPNPDFYCRPDGTFQNTKLFKGTYLIEVDGPFIPLIRETEEGIPLADESKEMEIKGVTEVRFEVEPFLNVEFVGDPMVSNGKITARVRVTRGVSEDIFREKIEPMGSYDDSFQNVTDIQLFVSYSSTVGYRARDERWSNKIEYSGSEFESLLGEPVTIKSLGTIPSGRKVFIRAAARINYDTPKGSGTRRWNYSAPVEVMIP